MKKRYSHMIVTNCSIREVYDYENEGWEVCGVNGNTRYPNPTIYFKKPYEESDKKSSE